MEKYKTTAVTLPVELVQTIERLIAAGRVRDFEDVLTAGVEAITAADAEQQWLKYARERFQQGLEAQERGETLKMTRAEFMASVDAAVDAELAVRGRAHDHG